MPYNAFITSQFVINNSLLHELLDTLLNKLQIILNAAACLITKTPKYNHIIPILKQIHWLTVSQRITYKVLHLVFKVLRDMAPLYINTNAHARTATYGDIDFSVYVPTLWNRISIEMRKCDTLSAFKSLLKTHVFIIAYG